MSERQKQLLKLLRGSKPGLSVDEISKALEIPAMRCAPAFRDARGGRLGCGWRLTSLWGWPPAATLRRPYRAWH